MMKEKHVRCFCTWSLGIIEKSGSCGFMYFWIKGLHEVSGELVLFKSYVPNILSVISGSVC